MIGLQPTRLSHSEISGSKVICTYPKLIAAYHVLHRLRGQGIRHAPLLTFFLPTTYGRYILSALTLLFYCYIMSKIVLEYSNLTDFQEVENNGFNR